MPVVVELRKALSFIRNGGYTAVTLALATFDQGDEVPTYRSLKLSEAIADDFGSLAADCTRNLARMDGNGDLVVQKYTAGYKLDRHEIEWLPITDDDLKHLPLGVPSPAQIPLLGDIDDFVDRVRFYIIILSGARYRVVLISRYNRNKELLRSKYLMMRRMGDRYERLEEPTFQFAPTVDALLCEDRLFILNKSNLEHIFRYHDLLKETAKDALDTVRAVVPIQGFGEFRESCLGHLQKVEKLRNIANKGYLPRVTMADIKRTIAAFRLDIAVEVVDGEERLVFNRRDRWAILNLLDDAYLGSQMTGLKYETNSKRQM